VKHRPALLLLLASLCPATVLAQQPVTPQDTPTDEVTPVEEAAPEGTGDDSQANDEEQQDTSATAAASVAAEGEMATETEPLDQPSLAGDLAAAEAEGDEEDAASEADEDEGPKLPWRNSLFLWDNEITTATFDPGATLTHNPTWVMAFSLQPRWYFTDQLSLRLRQDLSIEMTDTDSRVRNREPVLADTIIDLGMAKLYEMDALSFSALARLTLPTSISSRAYQKFFGLGAVGSADYALENVLHGLSLGGALGYSYSIAGSNVVLTEDDYPQAVANGPRAGLDSGNDIPAQAGGSSAVGHSFTFGLSASLAVLENMSIDGSFTWWWQQGRGLADAEVPVASAPGGVVVLGDGSDSHLRLLTWFTLGVGYDITDWVNASLTYACLTSEFNPDATRRNPFWNVDSSVALTATVTLDKAYNRFFATPPEQEAETQVARTSEGRRRAAQ